MSFDIHVLCQVLSISILSLELETLSLVLTAWFTSQRVFPYSVAILAHIATAAEVHDATRLSGLALEEIATTGGRYIISTYFFLSVRKMTLGFFLQKLEAKPKKKQG